MIRTDVSYFQHPTEMPSVVYAHHDGFTIVELDSGVNLYLTPDQLAYLYDRLGDAVETRTIREEKQAVDYATL